MTFDGRERPAAGIITKTNRKNVIELAEDGTKQHKFLPGLLTPLRNDASGKAYSTRKYINSGVAVRSRLTGPARRN